MQLKFFLLVFLMSFDNSDAYVPRFFMGRPRDGFVRPPGLGHLSLKERIEVLFNPVPDQWFTQKLNHFDGSDTRTWKQRYFTNAEFYKEGGPLFVMIGGEGRLSSIWMKYGYWIELAKTHNAYCVALEHRYYGPSRPTPDTTVENLAYLSSEQALADLATFIADQKALIKAKKVITFGGSYPGTLSAFFRLKYPHLVDGAVSSSAPILAKVDFKEYLQVVTTSLGTYKKGQTCVSAIRNATDKFETLMKSDDGRKKLKNMFKLCENIDPTNSNDVSNLYSALAENYEAVVQYNTPHMGLNIDYVCGVMTDSSSGDELERYAKMNSIFLDNHVAKCLEFNYKGMIESLRQTSWNSSAAEGSRQWMYQVCSEFSFLATSDDPKQPFGHHFPLKFCAEMCSEVFGSRFTEQEIQAAVNRSNLDYGGLDVQYDHVVFINGLIDPWHALGKLNSTPTDQAIVIPGESHCADMHPPSKKDSPSMVQARKDIAKHVSQWINERS